MQPDERPDLVLVMTDQQRFDQLGYADGSDFHTPTLDALAARGVIFDAAYSAATTCVPARTALLTGIHPHRLPSQENGAALREGFWTVAHALRAAGYQTALVGKMHFAPVHSQHGFEVMRLCEHLPWQGLGPLSRERGDELDDFHEWLSDNGLDDWRLPTDGGMPHDYPASAHPTAWVAREAISFLEARDRSRPCLLVVSFPHPHAPYDPPEPYASMFDPRESSLPKQGYELNEGLPLVFQIAAAASRTRAEAANEQHLRRVLASMSGLVTQIDDAIATIVEHVDFSRSLMLFTSDHGDYSGHRGLMRKSPIISFDDLARVPMFATGLGVTPGRRVAEVVQSCDIPLTLLDYAGIDAPDVPDRLTRSLRPVLQGAGTDADRVVVCGTHGIGWPMIRRGRYKYIEHCEQREAVLFDLERDPSERVNVAGDAAHAHIATELAEMLHAIRRQDVLDLAAVS
jgi:arylsulfatase A-like enzyme